MLVVDDTVGVGGTMNGYRQRLARYDGQLVWAAVYYMPDTNAQVDLAVKPLRKPHILEWNIYNTFWTQLIGVDMDGVLCEDCPPCADDDGPKYKRFLEETRPLHIPRFKPVRAIITSRMEKYRDVTEWWLKKHGAKYKTLHMVPAQTLQERAQMNIPQWKAEICDRERCEVFLESSKGVADAMLEYTRECWPIWTRGMADVLRRRR